MKFLCEGCKAKYTIPDEKVAGKTLRMTCRRCGEEILIRGQGVRPSSPAAGSQPASRPARASKVSAPRQAPGGSAPKPAPAPRSEKMATRAGPKPAKGGSSAGPAPRASRPGGSALGAGFRQVSSQPHPQPQPELSEEWFVAVKGVPLGPMSLEEAGAKVASGDATAECLAWREGFEDWRPVAEIEPLAAFLPKRRPGAPPPLKARPPAPPARVPGASNVIPIGGRLGAAAEPYEPEDDEGATVVAEMPEALLAGLVPAGAEPDSEELGLPPLVDAELHAGDDLAGLPAIEPLAAPALAAPALAAPALAAPALAAPAAPSPPGAEPDRRRGIPIGAWIAIAAAVAFGAVFAQQLATRLLGPQPVAVAVPAPALPPEAPSAPRSDLALEEPEVLPGPSAAELAAEAAAAEAAATEAAAAEAAAAEAAATEAAATEAAATGSERPQARARAQTGAGASAAPERALSAEEQALLERFGGGTSAAAPSKIRVTGIEARGATQRGPLEGGDVRRVVSENRVSLQRCYNRAIRGLPQPPDARMDIEVRVGASGVVTNVNVEGEDFGGLVGCLRTTVRRWRFPASADGGETRFPVVFTGSG